MNLDEARTILLRYTDWLKGRGNLSYLEHTPLPDFIERFFQEARPPEIKPEVHIALLCPHVAQDTTLVRYAFPLGDHSLRVCRACYDSIQGNILEDVVKESLKTMFGTWMMKDHKPFIG